MTIDEVKERLRAKFADAYKQVREDIRCDTTDQLEVKLAKAAESLPRFGQTAEWKNEWFLRMEFDVGSFESEFSLRRTSGWWIDGEDRFDGWNEKVTYCRALRDELAERYSREIIHELVDYDS